MEVRWREDKSAKCIGNHEPSGRLMDRLIPSTQERRYMHKSTQNVQNRTHLLGSAKPCLHPWGEPKKDSIIRIRKYKRI